MSIVFNRGTKMIQSLHLFMTGLHIQLSNSRDHKFNIYNNRQYTILSKQPNHARKVRKSNYAIIATHIMQWTKGRNNDVTRVTKHNKTEMGNTFLITSRCWGTAICMAGDKNDIENDMKQLTKILTIQNF